MPFAPPQAGGLPATGAPFAHGTHPIARKPSTKASRKRKRTLTEPAGTGRRPAMRAPSSARRTLSDAAPVGFHPGCPAHEDGPGACRRRCAGDQGGRESADSSAGRGGAAWTVQQDDERRGGRVNHSRRDGKQPPVQQSRRDRHAGKSEQRREEGIKQVSERLQAQPMRVSRHPLTSASLPLPLPPRPLENRVQGKTYAPKKTPPGTTPLPAPSCASRQSPPPAPAGPPPRHCPRRAG